MMPPFYSTNSIQSVRDNSEHCENGKQHACGYYGEPIGSHHWATHL